MKKTIVISVVVLMLGVGAFFGGYISGYYKGSSDSRDLAMLLNEDSLRVYIKIQSLLENGELSKVKAQLEGNIDAQVSVISEHYANREISENLSAELCKLIKLRVQYPPIREIEPSIESWLSNIDSFIEAHKKECI